MNYFMNVCLALILASSLTLHAEDLDVPWSEIDQLFKLDLEESFKISANEVAALGCSKSDIEAAKRQEKQPAPSTMTFNTLNTFLGTRKTRNAVLAAREPHQLYLLGRILEINLLTGNEKDLDAKKVLTKAAEAGDIDAKSRLIYWSMKYADLDKLDWTKNWKDLNALADKGSAEAYVLLSQFYTPPGYSKYNDRFVAKEKASEMHKTWICKAAELGYPRAYWACGTALYGSGKPKDPALVEMWMDKAATARRIRASPPSMYTNNSVLKKRWDCHVPSPQEICSVCASLIQRGILTETKIPRNYQGTYTAKGYNVNFYLILGASNTDSRFIGGDMIEESGMYYYNVFINDLEISDTGKIEFSLGAGDSGSKPYHPKDKIRSKNDPSGASTSPSCWGKVKYDFVELSCDAQSSDNPLKFKRIAHKK